jgi:hypothetical protein
MMVDMSALYIWNQLYDLSREIRIKIRIKEPEAQVSSMWTSILAWWNKSLAVEDEDEGLFLPRRNHISTRKARNVHQHASDSRALYIKKSWWLDTLEAVVEAPSSSEWGNESRGPRCKDNTKIEYCSKAEGDAEEAKVNSNPLDEVHAS